MQHAGSKTHAQLIRSDSNASSSSQEGVLNKKKSNSLSNLLGTKGSVAPESNPGPPSPLASPHRKLHTAWSADGDQPAMITNRVEVDPDRHASLRTSFKMKRHKATLPVPPKNGGHQSEVCWYC